MNPTREECSVAPKLFTPHTIRRVTLKNRIVLSPMLTYRAHEGRISDWHLIHLGKFAIGGAGLVFMESTKVDARGCTTAADTGLWDDSFIEPLIHITRFIKQHGAVPGIQLSHSGRKARTSLPWEGRAPTEAERRPDGISPWELIAPSAIPHADGHPMPREMTKADIEEIVDAWGKAAARAHAAGFDVVEIHGAHGYLIHQFLNPNANQRTDEYGGSLENRMRFATEVAKSVRRSWPEGKPLFFRMSAIDNDGWEIEDSVALAKLLRNTGVDVIDCTTGGMAITPVNTSVRPLHYGYQVPHAERIRREAEIETMAVGLIIHAEQAEAILERGQADLIALGREMLHNPNWPIDAAEKLGLRPSNAVVPDSYGYWLDKRNLRGIGAVPSTWLGGKGT